MSKLLNKPLRTFTLYSLITLALSIPAYYWVVDAIWLHELDIHNKTIEGHIKDGFKSIHLSDDQISDAINIWSQVQPGVKITPVQATEVRKDSVYEVIRPNKYAHENYERFRGRSTYFYIHNKLYHLIVETNVEETHETVIAIAAVTVLFFSLLVFGFIILNRRIASQIWAPFKNTLNQLKSFNLDSQKPIRLSNSDIEEFEELNLVLTKLIDNNIAVYNQQKQFAENASHELQTPLALLKSKIDLLLQDKSLTKKQLGQISALSIPLSRVSRINKNLLLLAKIESYQYSEQEIADLSDVLNENIEILSDYANNSQIRVENYIKGPIKIKGSRHLLEIMLTNLLVNAIRHNTEGGVVGIDYHASAFKIYNSGTQALNKDTLFKRFISTTAQSINSGLGLAIVKEICNRHGWEITYNFENKFHLFSVRFS